MLICWAAGLLGCWTCGDVRWRGHVVPELSHWPLKQSAIDGVSSDALKAPLRGNLGGACTCCCVHSHASARGGCHPVRGAVRGVVREQRMYSM
jgi:hypothetical protein